MADLLTHIAITRIVATPVRSRTFVLLILFGTCLPDLASKFLNVIIDAPLYAAMPTHSVAGIFLIAFATSFFFEESIRGKAFLSLLFGSALHVAVDVLKDTPTGGIPVFFPISHRGYEFGWFPSEESLYFLPVAILILLFYAGRARVR